MNKLFLICTTIGMLLSGCSETTSSQSSAPQAREVTPTQALLNKIPSSYFELAQDPKMKMKSQQEFDSEMAQNTNALSNIWNNAESTNDMAEKKTLLCMGYVPTTMLLVTWIAANPEYAVNNNQYGDPDPYLNSIEKGINSAGGCN